MLHQLIAGNRVSFFDYGVVPEHGWIHKLMQYIMQDMAILKLLLYI